MAPGRAAARATDRAAGQGSVISVPPPQRAPDRGQGAPGSRAASTPVGTGSVGPARTELSGVPGGAAPEAVAQLRAGWPGSGGRLEEAPSTAGPDWGAGREGCRSGPGLGDWSRRPGRAGPPRLGRSGAERRGRRVRRRSGGCRSQRLHRCHSGRFAVGGAWPGHRRRVCWSAGSSGWLVDVPLGRAWAMQGGTAGRAAAWAVLGAGAARDAPVHAWAAPRRRPRTPARRAAWPLDGGSTAERCMGAGGT